jgi:hypothetical protein
VCPLYRILNTTIVTDLVISSKKYIYIMYSSQKENAVILLNKRIIVAIAITVTATASNKEF